MAAVEKKKRLETYEEFWPYYLKEHSKDKTRHLHYLGSGLALTALCGAVVKRDARLLAAIPIAGLTYSTNRATCSSLIAFKNLMVPECHIKH